MAGGKIRKKNPSSANCHQRGIHLYKSKEQHILKNPMLVDAIVQNSAIKSTDVVLEIGPCTGNLTKKFLEVAKTVIVVELDPCIVLELQRHFQGTEFTNQLKVIQGDVLKCELPYFDVCVANIPYQISSPFLFKLLSHKPSFRSAVIMFQREFAMRLVAKPDSMQYCRLSVNTQLLARVSHLFKIGKNNFLPPTRGDSSVVMIEPRRPLPPVCFKEWDGLVRICFNQKSKTLGSIFRQKKVLSPLERNFNAVNNMLTNLHIWQKGSFDEMAMEDVEVLGDISGDSNMEVENGKYDDEEMEIVGEDGDMGGYGSTFKDIVIDILRQGGLEEKRACKLTQAYVRALDGVFFEDKGFL